jgi:hypothetical protein
MSDPELDDYDDDDGLDLDALTLGWHTTFCILFVVAAVIGLLGIFKIVEICCGHPIWPLGK